MERDFQVEVVQGGRKYRVEYRSVLDSGERDGYEPPHIPHVECCCKRCQHVRETARAACDSELYLAAEKAAYTAKWMQERVLPGAYADLFLCPLDPDGKPPEPLRPKLEAMTPERRKATTAQMREAYEWFMSDERVLYRVEHEHGKLEVTASLPFLVACEAARVDPECWYARIRRDLQHCGLTPDMLTDDPDMQARGWPDELSNEAETACLLNPLPLLASTGPDEVLDVEDEAAPEVEPPAPPSADPAPGSDVGGKIAGWFRALRRRG